MEGKGGVYFHLKLPLLLDRPRDREGLGKDAYMCSLFNIFFIIYLFNLYWDTRTGKAAPLNGQNTTSHGKISAAFRKKKGCVFVFFFLSKQTTVCLFGDELDLFSTFSSPDSLSVKVSLDTRLFSYRFITSP